tara:strand:+ start:202 stop:492 length:291 start_codon:yes stop_codon:yes gene_type:complete
LSINKSNIINKLANNYPSFYKKDLRRLVDIFFSELRNSLKRRERVELRDVFTLEPKLSKAKFARNPRTNEKIYVKEKYSISFRLSKMWLKKINEEK